MNIFDFITQEEIDDLPDDDPKAAFATFVRIAQERLQSRLGKLDGNDRDEWTLIEEARYGFMNVVVAAAKKYGIEPIAPLSVPRLTEFNYDVHKQFKADLDHYLTQLILDNSSRAKRDSVFISYELKTTIRTYVHHLRQAIEKSSDISEARRHALLKKLTEFEAELEKKRLGLLAVTILTITILGVPGNLGSTYDVANRLLSSIWRSVAEAKVVDDEQRRLPSAEKPIAITGPRVEGDFGTSRPRGAGKRNELDDDIPF